MKDKKISLKAAILITAAAMCVTFLSAAGLFSPNRDDPASQLNNVKGYIEEFFYGDYEDSSLTDGALKGLVSALEDDYSLYMNQEEYQDSVESSNGYFSGVGITVTLNEDKQIEIIEVTQDGPAEKAGLKAGDILIAVDNEDITDTEYQDALDMVKGQAGTQVSLKVLRDSKELDFTMTREEINTTSVTSEILNDDIGYIRINSFKKNTSYQFNVELQNCLSAKVKGIIFDLRNNGGGLVSACSECLDPLLPDGDVAVAEYKDGSTKVICESVDGLDLDMPMVVLVNENSASAAELFSAALRDFKDAPLVGKNTFGKGIMQNTFELSNGGGLRLTVAKYRTVKSECYHEIGLKPDYDIDLPEEYENTPIGDIPTDKDLQLQKAIEILS